jgi:hypothetical protein
MHHCRNTQSDSTPDYATLLSFARVGHRRYFRKGKADIALCHADLDAGSATETARACMGQRGYTLVQKVRGGSESVQSPDKLSGGISGTFRSGSTSGTVGIISGSCFLGSLSITLPFLVFSQKQSLTETNVSRFPCR